MGMAVTPHSCATSCSTMAHGQAVIRDEHGTSCDGQASCRGPGVAIDGTHVGGKGTAAIWGGPGCVVELIEQLDSLINRGMIHRGSRERQENWR